MRNEHNPCNSSITDDVNCWRTTNCDATESKKVVHSSSIASSPTDLCSCQTICPNPDIQRRVSTDGVSLTKSPRFTDLSWSNGKIFKLILKFILLGLINRLFFSLSTESLTNRTVMVKLRCFSPFLGQSKEKLVCVNYI